MMSQVFLQYYQTSNEAKIVKGYKDLSYYRDMRQFHKQASNCVVATLNFLLKDFDQGRRVWSNLTQGKFLKLAMEQLL